MNYKGTMIALMARGGEIAYVVMRHGEIWRWGIKTIRCRRSGRVFTQRVERALFSILELGGKPPVVVVEKQVSPRGGLCRAIPNLLKRWEKDSSDSLRYLSIQAVKQRVCGNCQATHRELVEAVAKKHPILWSLTTGEKAKTKYWEKVFIAVAMGQVIQASFPHT